MKTRKPIPKTQAEISQEVRVPYSEGDSTFSSKDTNRGYRRSVKDDASTFPTLGLKDIDETIIYYFDNVIKPSVIKNGNRINVPILYGSPERWASVQKNGYFRDKNGKLQTPLIMFKRDSIEKNRQLGNKLDANNVNNFTIFEKKYSKKNIYDKFSVLTNRVPVREFHGVIIPDYVNITYSCVLFTDYVEQMNKLIEGINFASDTYWGDPERFKFRAMIDTYNNTTELSTGADRVVKTDFTINLLGYIIPDTINTSKFKPNKFYSKSRLNFKLETENDYDTLVARSKTPEREASRRFFDTSLTGAQALSSIVKIFLETNTTAVADSVIVNQATFSGKTILTPPPGFTVGQESFVVYVNGISIPTSFRDVQQVGSDIVVTFNETLIGYPIEAADTVILTGKFT